MVSDFMVRKTKQNIDFIKTGFKARLYALVLNLQTNTHSWRNFF